NISCEGVIDCCGFMPATSIRDTSAEVGSARNITFTNCITSDISGNANTVGFFMVSNPGRIQPDLGLGRSTNIVFQNCIAERIYGSTDTYKVAGICQGL